MNAIGFPGLGIGPFNMQRVAFSIGPLTVYWYAIILVTGIVAGFVFALHEAKRLNLDTEVIYDLVLWGLPIAIIFARAYYVIFSWDEMEGNILNAFKIWDGGIAIYGSVIGAALTGIVYCRVKHLKIGLVFDVCAIPLMLGQAIGRWGNFANAEVYGRTTDVLWRMSVNGTDVHPLFLYESIWMLLGIAIFITYKNRKKFDGEIFLLYIVWYGIGRGFLEGMRQNVYVLKMFGTIPVSQMLAAVSAVLAIMALVYFYVNRSKLGLKATTPYVHENQLSEIGNDVVKIVDFTGDMSEDGEMNNNIENTDERKNEN